MKRTRPLKPFTALPKALQQALLQLSTTSEIGGVQAALMAAIQQTTAEDEGEQINFEQPEPELEAEWAEGTDEFAKMSEADLWHYLGFSSQKIPFFNDRIDPSGKETPWTDEGAAFFAKADNGEILQPRWHQLVGICKMMQNAFAGKSVLLMDEVGLGKTLQAAAVTAILAFYREAKKETGKFPGHFG